MNTKQGSYKIYTLRWAIYVVQERNRSTTRRPYTVSMEEHTVIYNTLFEIQVQLYAIMEGHYIWNVVSRN